MARKGDVTTFLRKLGVGLVGTALVIAVIAGVAMVMKYQFINQIKQTACITSDDESSLNTLFGYAGSVALLVAGFLGLVGIVLIAAGVIIPMVTRSF